MLTAFFKAFFGVSLSLSPLILFFNLTQPALRERYSLHLSYWVWLVFALRLVLPIPLYGGGSPLLISSGEAVYFLEQDPSVAARAFAEIASRSSPDGAAPLSGQAGISWMGVGAMIWLVGAVVFFLFHLIAQSHMQRELRRWSVPVQNPAAVALFEQSKQKLSVTKPIRLCACMRVTSPMLAGFFRPTVLLPHADLQEEQLTSIFCHELMHDKRGDLWYKLLLMTVLALHWYNPLVYLLVRQAEYAMELACDDDVLHSNGISRKEYGLAILSQLQPVKTKRMMLSTQFYGRKEDMKIRIQQIADASCKKRGLPLLALCTAFITAGSLLIGCAPLSSQAQSPSSQVVSSQEAAFVSSGPEEEADLVEEVGEREISSESTLDAANSLQDLLDRIASDSTSQYPGGTMAWPAPEASHIIVPYGWFNGGTGFNTGINIGGKDARGTPVIAAQDGTVAFANDAKENLGGGYGRYLILDHGGGIATLYAHLNKLLVREGETVVKGQQIGEIGSSGNTTGANLHFEVREKGLAVDPVNYLTSEEEQEEQPVLVENFD